MTIVITTNATDVSSALRDVAMDRLPSVLRNAINDLAKDIVVAQRAEMSKVFDRPTPFILNGLRVQQWAKKEKLESIIGFKDNLAGKSWGGVGVDGQSFNALTPHIPGYPAKRRAKGLERWLRNAGYIDENEWMVPTRAVKRDAYGNVAGSVIAKMLADIGAYRNSSGFASAPTGKGRTRRSQRKRAQYVFGTVKGKKGLVKGIWWVKGGADNHARGQWIPMMIATSKAPTYRKTYDFWAVGQATAGAKLPSYVAKWANIELSRTTA